MFKLVVQWNHYVLQYHAARSSPSNVKIYSEAFLIVIALCAGHVYFARNLHARSHNQQLRIPYSDVITNGDVCIDWRCDSIC